MELGRSGGASGGWEGIPPQSTGESGDRQLRVVTQRKSGPDLGVFSALEVLRRCAI